MKNFNKLNTTLLLCSVLTVASPTLSYAHQNEEYGSDYETEQGEYKKERGFYSKMMSVFDGEDDHHNKDKKYRNKNSKKDKRDFGRILSKLNLSEEQQQNLDNLMEAFSQTRQAEKENKKQHMRYDKKTKGLMIGFLSQEELNEIVEQNNAKMKEELNKRYSHSKAILNILNDEQKSQLKSLLEKRGGDKK